ncbi:MAG: ATP-dependent helicase HrpB [Cyclobacteriaceae bacterium]
MSAQTFDWTESELPIKEVIPELLQKVLENPKVILQAPPGAGKSTLLPLALLKLDLPASKKIIMLEPRRLAAKSIAQRMAELLGESVGQTVGYRIRFESRISDHTRIEVITEGILTRMLLADNAIEDIAIILFDEFHERSIHADLALALSLQSQEILREDLKLIIMSATLNADELSKKLNAPVILSEGKQYPVITKQHEDADPHLLAEQCVPVIRQAYKETDGDILVFLPGQKEIIDAEFALKRDKSLLVYPLYGALPFPKQWKAIQPDTNGRRRIVLATSIAETSLTIEGISTVVDTGFGRSVKYDPGSGLSRLYTYRISQDEAKQRSGRAGRLRKGTCYRMWSTGTNYRMDSHRSPEILHQDLTPLVLSLFSWGIDSPENLTWLDPLPNNTYYKSVELLEQLGAIDELRITPLGEEMANLPCHPRIAHMLLEAKKEGDLPLACDIAALIEERDPLRNEPSTDISLRIDWLRRKRADNSSERSFKRINEIALSYAGLLGTEVSIDSYDPFESGILLSYAYPERIAGSQGNKSGRFQLSNGHVVKLNRDDELYASAWIVIANMNARESTGKVFLAAEINPPDLAAHVREKEVIAWDEKQGKLITQVQMRVGGLVLSSQPLLEPSIDRVKSTILRAVKKLKGNLLNIDEEVEQLINRNLIAERHFPEKNFPKLNPDILLGSIDQWLSPYLGQVKTERDLKKIDIAQVLFDTMLSYDQQQLLKKEVPDKISVPSGSTIKLQYQEKGDPILAVRIQEVFGLTETPTICNGKQKVLIHLLSPGFKPVQVTSDLSSFWSSAYYEVKKELKGRYPKHVWPDDPRKEPPTNRSKKRS